MIRVSKKDFFEILADDKYVRGEQGEGITTSCPRYNIINKETNEVVGRYSDGSWQNFWEVKEELLNGRTNDFK